MQAYHLLASLGKLQFYCTWLPHQTRLVLQTIHQFIADHVLQMVIMPNIS